MKAISNTRFFVYRSAFHGGSKIHECDNIKEALNAAQKDHNNKKCDCGGCVIKIFENQEEQTLEEWAGQFTSDELLEMGFSF